MRPCALELARRPSCPGPTIWRLGVLCRESHAGDGLQVALGQATNAQCAQPATPQAGNGACDQFGGSCRMWECPDAFDMGNGTWAFKWSDQVTLAMYTSATTHTPPCL